MSAKPCAEALAPVAGDQDQAPSGVEERQHAAAVPQRRIVGESSLTVSSASMTVLPVTTIRSRGDALAQQVVARAVGRREVPVGERGRSAGG